MSRTCSICTSARRPEIELAMAAGRTYRDTAERYGTSKSALERHRPHVGRAIVKAAERREENFGDSLLDQMRSLQARTLKLLDDAEKDEDGRLRAVAIVQVRENLTLLSRLTGELKDTAPAQVAVVLRWGDDPAMGVPRQAALPAAPPAIEAELVKAEEEGKS